MKDSEQITTKLKTDISIMLKTLKYLPTDTYIQQLDLINSLLESLRYYSDDRDFALFMDTIQYIYYPYVCKGLQKTNRYSVDYDKGEV